MKNLKGIFKVLISCHVILLQVSVALSTQETHASLVGGEPTTINKAPFAVQIFKNGNFHCGGTLISENRVITAAHCVYNTHELSFEVVSGASKRIEFGIRSEVNKIKIPKEFSRKDYNMDIAVLELKTPLRGESVRPIDLCKDRFKPGDEVKLFGWGKLKDDDVIFPIQLQTTTVKVISTKTCADKYRSKNASLTDSMFCAAAPEKDACFGDSGGPAIINKQLCGVVSVGHGCGHNEYPGIFTDVLKMREVIAKL